MRWLFPGLALAGVLLAGTAVVAPVDYRDIGLVSGLSARNTFGGLARKDYILETTGNGAAILDYDGDGRDDIFIANGTTLGAAPGTGPLPQLYHNDGNGHFTERAAEAGFRYRGWGQGVCAGDFDNDGHTDLLVTYFGHNILYRNRGNGTFEDVTEKARLPVTGSRYGSGCTFVDYDRDGKLDLFISNYVDLDLAQTPKPGQNGFCEWKGLAVMCGPRGLPLAHNLLYHNNGDGTFTDVSEAAGILKPGGRYSLQVVAADFDNDGWPDLYVACDMTPSLLYHNRHDGTFEERGVEAGVAYNYDGQLQAGMGVAVADYDGDGLLDIAKTNFSGDLTSLFHNDDGKFFTDVSREAGLNSRQLLGWGIVSLDVDDDGWRDFIIANGHVYPEVEGAHLGDTYRQPMLLWRNRGNGKFADITQQAGAAFQVSRPARGLAFGDLDGDGRPELLVVNMNDKPDLLRNHAREGLGHFVNVALEGTVSNRSAIGARVTVAANGRKWIDEVMSGASYYSQNSFTLHFGLGSIGEIDSLEVRWPNDKRQSWTKLPVDRLIHVTEGRDALDLKPYSPRNPS